MVRWFESRAERATKLRSKAYEIFVPSKPITRAEQLFGRDRDLARTVEALQTPGRSVFIFGERGVGKTSLARSAANRFNPNREPIVIACSPEMTFAQMITQVVRRILELPILEAWKKKRLDVGLRTSIVTLAQTIEKASPLDSIASTIDVNDAVDVLKEITAGVSEPIAVVIDELDVVQQPDTRKRLAHFLKQLGDKECPVKFILVGIAEDMNKLLDAHESASRYLASVKLERLGLDTMARLLEGGLRTARHRTPPR